MALYLKYWLTVVVLHAIAIEHSGLVRGLYFTSEPQDVVGVKGSELLLNCSATSPAGKPVNITWLKDGQEVDDTRRSVLRNGSLHFKKVINRRSRSDEGYYECLASDQNGTIISRKAKLTCASITRISGVELSVVAIEDEVVRLQCPISAVPAPTISWQIDRRRLPRNDTRYTRLPSGVLQIVGVMLSDEGRYRCVGSNLAGSRSSKEFEVSVEVRGEGNNNAKMLASSQQYLSKRVGETALFECAASGYPQPEISWTHNGDDVRPGGRVKMIGQGNVELSNVQLEDAGAYICTARPGGDQLPLTMTATLKVVEKPELVLQPVREERVIVAHTIRLSCGFTGSPTPQVTWFKNGERIVFNGRIKMQDEQVVISQSESRDSGYYQCRAENEAGMAQGTIHVSVEPSTNAPSPPENVRAETLGPNSIRVTWDEAPPKNGQNTFAYSAHYIPTKAKGGLELQRVVEETSVVLDQLKAFTNYTFYVVAYNNGGASSHSQRITQMTAEDVPLSAPDVRVQALGATSLKVEWDKLDMEDSRGVITKYQVFYRKTGQQSQKRAANIPGTSTEYIITGLETHTKYDVRVLAGTKAGYPNLDDFQRPWTTGTTGNPGESLAPETPVFQVTNTTLTTLAVRWEPVHPSNVPIIGYKLFIHKQPTDINGKKMIIHLEDTHEHVFSNLDVNTWYEVSLLAFNDNGMSEPIVLNAHTKAEKPAPHMDPPPPPQNVDAKPVNDTTITVHWIKPSFSQPIRYYTVRYKIVKKDIGNPLFKGGSADEQFLDTETAEAVVTNLKPFKLYEFDVKAHTDYAEGPYSSVVQCSTLEGRPSEPENVRFSLIEPGAVELRWQEPREKNGVIVSYLVKYSNNLIEPDKWPVKKENGTATFSRIHDLEEDAVYYFKVQAATKAGEGPATRTIEVRTQHIKTVIPLEKTMSKPSGKNDQNMGIIVGVSIGGACIAICILIFLLRNRCFPPRSPPSAENAAGRRYNGNGYLPNSNGNPHMTDSTFGSLGLSSELHEMDSMQPMITSLSDSDHLDTKGGYDYIISPDRNGVVAPVNGLRVNLKPNGQVPLRVSSLPESQQEEGQRLVEEEAETLQTVPAQHLDSLENIDLSENSNDENRPAPYLPNADDDAVAATFPAAKQLLPPNNKHQIDSNTRAGHQPSSHRTGSNNRGGVADDSIPGRQDTAAGTSIDSMQNSGDRGDAGSSYASQPPTGQGAHIHQPHRHASSTSPNSASQEHFRESGLTRELGAPSREVPEEAPSSYASQSRSQGQVSALSATSLYDNSPPPQDQVTFSPTANHMHTNEQVLNRQI